MVFTVLKICLWYLEADVCTCHSPYYVNFHAYHRSQGQIAKTSVAKNTPAKVYSEKCLLRIPLKGFSYLSWCLLQSGFFSQSCDSLSPRSGQIWLSFWNCLSVALMETIIPSDPNFWNSQPLWSTILFSLVFWLFPDLQPSSCRNQ